MARSIVSMRERVPTGPRRDLRGRVAGARTHRACAYSQGVYEALLQVGEPVVGGVAGVARIVPVEGPHLLQRLLGDVEARAEREPQVVERPQPGLRLLGVEVDLAALAERLEDGLGGGALGLAQP